MENKYRRNYENIHFLFVHIALYPNTSPISWQRILVAFALPVNRWKNTILQFPK
jgi:hypothetical protein